MLQNDPLWLPPFYFNADPDPAFHFDADPDLYLDSAFHFERYSTVRIRIYFSIMIRFRICNTAKYFFFFNDNIA